MIAAGEAAADPPGAAAPARYRVLVADDEERLRQVLVRILRGHGIDAEAAAEGTQAVAMARAGGYDLVILDLLMPGMDGFSALREIMRHRPDQAVLVLSCLGDPESKMAGFGLGADDYVPKPFHVASWSPACRPGCAPPRAPGRASSPGEGSGWMSCTARLTQEPGRCR